MKHNFTKTFCLTFFCILALTANLFASDTLRIGVVIGEKGNEVDIASPTRKAMEIALENSPLNKSLLLLDKRYWKCERNVLEGFDEDQQVWSYPVKLLFSEKNTVNAQIQDLIDNDSVLIIVGLPSSQMVNDIFETTLNTPVISTVATASEFTIKSRNNFRNDESLKWENNHRWFFRATSPDIVRMEALLDWLKEENVKNSYILHSGNTYGMGLLQDLMFLNQKDPKGITIESIAFSDGNSSPDPKKIDIIKQSLRENRNKIESIILLGNSKDETLIIKEIKKYTSDIPIYVVDPNMSKKNGYFWGKEFDKVRALSAQILWEGNYGIKQFTETYSRVMGDENFVRDQTVPLAAGFAYDAIIIALSALHHSIEFVSPQTWDSYSNRQKKELLDSSLGTLGNLPLIMSKGQMTYTHDVIAELQRTYIEKNQFYLFTRVPRNFSWFWILIFLGGAIGGLSRVIVYIHSKLKTEDQKKLWPGIQYVLSSILIGIFGALMIEIFWDTKIMNELLPKFFDQFTLEENTFVIGVLGGIVPTAIIAFVTKTSPTKND